MINVIKRQPVGVFERSSPPTIFGTVYYQLQGYQDENYMFKPANSIEPGQTAWMCAGYPGSILVAKANHYVLDNDIFNR